MTATYKIVAVKYTRYEVRNFLGKTIARFTQKKHAEKWVAGYLAASAAARSQIK